jgi:hypothetical protein
MITFRNPDFLSKEVAFTAFASAAASSALPK